MQTIVNCAKKLFGVLTNRRYFTYVYTLVGILWFFPLLGAPLNIVSKGCFVWGICLMIWDLFVGRRAFCMQNARVIFLLLFCYVLTVLLGGRVTLYMGIKHLMYNGINLLILYAQDADLPLPINKRLFSLVNTTVTAVATLAALISLVMFARGVSFTFRQGGVLFRQGFMENRLFGIFTSPNTGALFMILGIAAIFLNCTLQYGSPFKWKWYHFVCAAPLLLYFSFSLSKGGFLTVFTLMILLTFLCGMPRMLQRCKRRLAALLATAFIATAAVGALYVGVLALRYVGAYVPPLFGSAAHDRGSPGTEGGLIKVELDRIETSDDISNGRTAIWKAGLAVWRQAPLFGAVDTDLYHDGVLRSKISEEQLSEADIAQLKRAQGSMHNSYLQVLVCSGAVGLILFMILALCIVCRYIGFLTRADKRSPVYALAAVLFSLLGAMAANSLVESHLLFTKQNPYGALFWLFAGMGLVLLSQMEKAAREEKGGSEVFICDTPYQLINAVCLAQQTKPVSLQTDLYIYDQFRDAAGMAKKLRGTPFFDHVYVFRRYPTHTGPTAKLATLFRLWAPRYMLRRHAMTRLPGTAYDRLYISCYTAFTDSVRLQNPQARVIQYEDGIGSYYIPDIEAFSRSGLFRFLNQTLLAGRLSYHVKELYLHLPDAYPGTAYTVLPLPPPAAAVLEKVFSYRENTLYTAHRTVYLTQPLAETAAGAAAAAAEREILALLDEDTVIRVHPRQDAAAYTGYTTDACGNLWELECARQITGAHTLIGAFSTAQFVPKMLFGIEPRVIFLYPLFPGAFENADVMVKTLRGMYTDPQKIVVADTIERLRDVLS